MKLPCMIAIVLLHVSMSSRATSSGKLTPAIVADVLLQNITPKAVERAKNKEGHLIPYSFFSQDPKHHKADRVALEQHKDLLHGLMVYSTVLDKSVLEKGLSLYNSKIGTIIQDVRTEAYHIKRMQMDVFQIRRNMKSGVRLQSWLGDLIKLLSPADMAEAALEVSGSPFARSSSSLAVGSPDPSSAVASPGPSSALVAVGSAGPSSPPSVAR
eukprot:1160447-Alexandrium_andersonii.AAC.1